MDVAVSCGRLVVVCVSRLAHHIRLGAVAECSSPRTPRRWVGTNETLASCQVDVHLTDVHAPWPQQVPGRLERCDLLLHAVTCRRQAHTMAWAAEGARSQPARLDFLLLMQHVER